MKFERNNEYAARGGHARRGARNKLDSYAYAVALAHVQHKRGDPTPAEYEKTNLWIALETTLKTNPRDYTRAIISMLPKQVDIDNTITRVTEIDQVIETIQAKLAAEHVH